MNVFRLCTISAVFCLVTMTTAAQISSSEENKIKVNGTLDFSIEGGGDQPIAVVFTDGRKATLQIREVQPLSMDIPLKVDETTCSAFKPKTCHLRMGFQSVDLALRWTKNPVDSDRVNKDVIFVSSENAQLDEDNKLVDFSEFWRSEFQKIYPAKTERIKLYELVCDDYRFITGRVDDTSAPNDLLLVDWGNELMQRNPETKANENRVFQGAMNVVFQRTDNNTLLLKDMGQVTSEGDGAPNLYFGDILGWTLRSLANQNLCQVSFKADSDATFSLAQRMLEEEQNKISFRQFAPENDKTLWTQFLNEDSYKISQAKMLEEPYKTMRILGLIDAYVSSTTTENGKIVREITITPKKVK